MSLIEQAAKRLEELRRAGVEIPDSNKADAGGAFKLPDSTGTGSPTDAGVEGVSLKTSGGLLGTSAVALPQPRHVELDLARLASAGLVSPNSPRSRVADEFRVLKRPLIANVSGKGAAPIKNGNLIMVTSAVPGEGKTFCAFNLAMSIVMELDRSVLLVDADVARPTLPTLLGFPSTKGLLDVLQDKTIDLSQVLLRTSVERFTVLAGGIPHPRATELLASEAMTRLLEGMAARYADRIIVFDSPPLLVTTEARVLASHMGQIVLVVQAESTLKSEVRQALAAIETCPVKMTVLNQARADARGAYGYHYGDGYGYGS